MVLWELTLATAYFLGLKRTYRLALKIQRRLISPKYPDLRLFLHRRTRAIFDMALKVHRNIQQRDLEVGRSLGNRILRWLDRMKPSANIRGAPEENLPGQSNANTRMNPSANIRGAPDENLPGQSNVNISTIKQVTSNHQRNQGSIQKCSTQSFKKGFDRYQFSTARNTSPKNFPGISMGSTNQYRQLWTPSCGRVSSEGIIRKDIVLWMQRN